MATLKVGDTIVLQTDLPEEGLTKGMLGCVVLTFTEPSLAYETEFVDDEGRTIAEVALTPDQVRKYEPRARHRAT